MRNLRTLVEWFPLIGLVTALGEAERGVQRVNAALQVLRYLAGKTHTEKDDELVRLIKNVMLTEQGQALIEYVSDEIHSLLEQGNV